MSRPSDSILIRVRLPLAAIVLIFLAGVVGYLVLGFTFVDALSQTVLVMTTVGFVSGAPLDATEKIFTNAIAILGVSAYLAMLAVSAAALADGQLGVIGRRRRMERRIRSLHGHYIVCAYGRVGRAAAQELAASGARAVVIDRLESLEPEMRADGNLYLIGDPTSPEVLARAGIERAAGLISAVDSDASSVFITLTARSMRSELFVVARASDPATPERLYRAGADRVVSPYVSSGRQMALLAVRPRIADYLEIAGHGDEPLRIEELVVDESSPLAGGPLDEAVAGATPLVLHRNGSVVPHPSSNEQLVVGDVIVSLRRPVD